MLRNAAKIVAAISIASFVPITAKTLEAKPYKHTKQIHKSLSSQIKKPQRKQTHNLAQITKPAECRGISRYCGCGASIEVFGRAIRELFLAANWFRFPKAQPAPGMVAVRQHHVFTIKKVINQNTVVAIDHNYGGRSFIHVRNLNGYSVRNPHG